jgi:hypothetical protein
VVRSAQPTELLLRHVQLSKDLEEERRANFTPAMERNGHGPSIAMHPAFMASRLATSCETEGRRDPLELARCGARHARFRSCPSRCSALLMLTRDQCEHLLELGQSRFARVHERIAAADSRDLSHPSIVLPVQDDLVVVEAHGAIIRLAWSRLAEASSTPTAGTRSANP